MGAFHIGLSAPFHCLGTKNRCPLRVHTKRRRVLRIHTRNLNIVLRTTSRIRKNPGTYGLTLLTVGYIAVNICSQPGGCALPIQPRGLMMKPETRGKFVSYLSLKRLAYLRRSLTSPCLLNILSANFCKLNSARALRNVCRALPCHGGPADNIDFTHNSEITGVTRRVGRFSDQLG